jgi:peptidyl-prolyl cis-trans isomerase B (cyclophilin B)
VPRVLSTLLAGICLVLAVGACGDDDENDGGQQPAQTSEQAAGCREVSAPQPKPDGGEERPKDRLDPGTTYVVTMETSCGRFSFELDQQTSPNTAASVAALVENGFYDGTTFHRIVPGFVIQGGDPTGTGTGGAGYSTRDVPPQNARYVKGVVAMAKAGNEPSGAASSQFYVVTGADIGLPPQYAVLGRVTDGLDVVELIGEQGDPATGEVGTPLQPIVIETATLTES